MIPVCFVLVHLVGAVENGRQAPDQPFRVYRGQNIAYGPVEALAGARTFRGARSVIYRPNGSLNVRETADQIDRLPCHEPGAK